MASPADVEALYRRFGPAIYRRCLRLLRNQAEAEDATQEVFVRAHRHAELLGQSTVALPWLYEVATRFCLNRLRDESRHGAALTRVAVNEEGADAAATFVERSTARSLLGRFDERTGLIAAYVLIDGMTQDETAQALQITRKTVGVRLQRFLVGAKKFLRSQS